MNKYFSGIGSRETPESLKPIIKEIVEDLNALGYTLRSGGAGGADSFFEEYAIKKEIYLPWKGFNENNSELYGVCEDALKIAEKYHPTWYKLKPGGKKVMARNVYQVLGKDLKTPVEFVICWTPGGKLIGGTSQAMRIAIDNNISIYNLFSDIEKLRELIKSKKENM